MDEVSDKYNEIRITILPPPRSAPDVNDALMVLTLINRIGI